MEVTKIMKIKLFGIGAAGNKAAINSIEKGIVSRDDVYLINTTTKDIPEEYKVDNSSMVIQFSSMFDGCGKEPKVGMKEMEQSIATGKIDFSSYIDDDTTEVVIVTSTEGGTGCGASPVIAKYFDLMNIPVHVFAFIGFQDEARGISNTLKFFNNISGFDNVILHTIMNDQFLDYKQNYNIAEAAANDEFATQLQILIGSKMIPSSQNIDDTDHYKITSTAGYMDIKHIPLTGVKNTDTFNDAVIKAFENSTGVEYDKGCKRLAVIVNAGEKIQESIDSKLDVIKRYSGEPFETYRHIQENPLDTDEYIDVIVCGINMPMKAVTDMNKKYVDLKSKSKAGVKQIDFSGIDLDDEDDFNIGMRKRNKNVNDLFAKSIGASPIKKEEKPAKDSKPNVVTIIKNPEEAY